MDTFSLIVIIVGSYLLGSIPTGYIIARLYGIQDIRHHGSGNIGATNVARILGLRFFIPIFFFDACKAYSNISMISYMGYHGSSIIVAALAHLIGNGCSIFLSGQGGKGIATSVGLISALQPLLMIPLLITWGIFWICTNIVGIASALSVLLLPIYSWLCGYSNDFLLFSCCITIWVLVRHRANINNAIVFK